MDNITSTLKNYGWAAGSIGGIIVGASVNFLENRTLFKKDIWACWSPFDGAFPFYEINNYRENELEKINGSIFTATLFHPFFPLIHVIPLMGFMFWNAIKRKKQDNLRIENKSILNTIKNKISPIAPPTIHSFFLVLGSNFVRSRIEHTASSQGIDISGHVFAQLALSIHMKYNAEYISKNVTPSQLKIYLIAILIISITDAIWMYNTAANCHSVADVACAVACVGLTQLGFQTIKLMLNEMSETFA